MKNYKTGTKVAKSQRNNRQASPGSAFEILLAHNELLQAQGICLHTGQMLACFRNFTQFQIPDQIMMLNGARK